MAADDRSAVAGNDRPLKRARLDAPTTSDQHLEATQKQMIPPVASLLRVRGLPEQFSRCDTGQN